MDSFTILQLVHLNLMHFGRIHTRIMINLKDKASMDEIPKILIEIAR